MNEKKNTEILNNTKNTKKLFEGDFDHVRIYKNKDLIGRRVSNFF